MVTEVKTYVNDVKCICDDFANIMTVEHRRNNPKRDFLFVNKYQGKHIPTEPIKVKALTNELGELVYNNENIDKNKPVLVVGFCETATLLGRAIAEYLADKNLMVYYMQTTREQLDCDKLFDFEEEHSHAVNEALYIKEKNSIDFESFGTAILVDDEISTGNTVLNFVEKIRCTLKNAKIIVASVCNWQDDRNSKGFKEKGISHIEIFKGKLKDSKVKLQCTQNTNRIHSKANNNIEISGYTIDSDLKILGQSLFKLERSGYWIDEKRKELERYLISAVVNTIVDEVKPGENIDIIGTEEFMYIPYKISSILASLPYNYKVTVHATTRSPIDVIDESIAENGDSLSNCIREAFEIDSPYEDNRTTYIYNLSKSNTVIITDTDNIEAYDKFIETVSKALSLKENKLRMFINV